MLRTHVMESILEVSLPYCDSGFAISEVTPIKKAGTFGEYVAEYGVTLESSLDKSLFDLRLKKTSDLLGQIIAIWHGTKDRPLKVSFSRRADGGVLCSRKVK